ncbi:MAG: beta-N-acetylhexosaminidase [Bradymonadales bacterium]
MLLKEAAGQIIIAGYEGERPSIPLEGAIKTGKIGGVILFRRNFTSLEQIAAQNEVLASMAPEGFPLFLCVDQEGGKVQRIKGDLAATTLPAAMQCMGKKTETVYELGRVMAKELKALGFNLNFAPVVDIHTNPENPIIADRAYACTKEEVSLYSRQIIRAHNDIGIASCAKHFPGHGDTDSDSHTSLPVLNFNIDALRERELVPFVSAIEEGVPMIMTAHILLPNMGTRHPATLSSCLIDDVLRKELGFEGVIVSDDLEMDAIVDNYSIIRATVLGLHAGVDAFIVSKSQRLWHNLRDQLVKAAEDDEQLRNAIHVAAERVLECKKRYKAEVSSDWQKIVACKEHREFIQKHFNG